MQKILIIEDDVSIAKIQSDFLKINGFDVTVKADGITGLGEALTGQYSLILLDLMLPGLDGFEVCKRIREKIAVPLLMVTAKIEDVDKIRGFSTGADDYIAKPFSLPELVARVKANLAQFDRITALSTPLAKEIQFHNIVLNPQTRLVKIGDNFIDLKTKEFDLLCFLMSNPDIVFSKEHLYERLWGMDAIGDLKTVVVHINRLREKIEKDPQNPLYIQTVWGAGYRFKT